MNAEERVLEAIRVTRSILERALNDPGTLVAMTAWDIEPEGLEDTITKILEYLDRSREEKSGGH